MSYNELKQHGTEDFPIELYHIEKEHARYEMSAHWHSEIELIRVLSGSLNVRLNQEAYRVEAGGTIFVNPETLHQAYPEDCIYECLVFHPDFIPALDDDSKSFMEGIKNLEYIVQAYQIDPKDPLNIDIHNLFNIMETDTPGSKLRVIGALYQLFGDVLDRKLYQVAETLPPSADKKLPKLKTVLSFIRGNYHSAITLEDIARAAGMSRKYVCSFFKEMTTKTPMEYLKLYRIERAARKLINTDMSVTEVALSCGFNDFSYFIKTFKQIKGTTPAKYRKSVQ
ncbi:MAG: AraC family transcriptional regulator [Firmicutes bacterium]|nr:AraC family transcriptional regulator [Bacillota bacterium]